MSRGELEQGVQLKENQLNQGKKRCKYKKITKKERRAQLETLLDFVDSFITENHYGYDDLYCNETTIYQVINKVHQRKQYFKIFHNIDMSDLKELALNSFWIVKLKPIMVNANLDENMKIEYRSINEKFAVYYIIKVLRVLANNLYQTEEEQREVQQIIHNFFDEAYIYELTYSLFYRDISKEAFIMLVETIAKGIGIQPYDTSSLSNSE